MMKSAIFSLVLISALACNPGASADKRAKLETLEEQTQPTVKRINKAELVDLLGKDTTIQLVDVRTVNETNLGTIDEAITGMDFVSGQFESKLGELDKNKPVVLYCASGRRSAKAAEILVENEFEQVYNYTGGYNEWSSNQ